MISTALALAVALLCGPPGERPPVQSPSITPIQPQVGEPAIAPAHVESVPEGEAMPAEPPPGEPVVEQPPVEPEPQPEPGGNELPSWQSGPVEPPPPTGDPTDVPLVDEWGVPVAPPPPKPLPPKGGGLYAGAGALLGIMITRQWITALLCEDVYCGWRGNFDRVMSLGVMGLAAGGGWLDGRRRAYIRHDEGLPPGNLVPRRAAGWTLFAVGLGGLIADTVFYNLCYQQALGPYTQLDGFRYTCSPIASVVVVDFSTAFGATGIALGMSAESQKKNRKKFDLALVPFGGRGQAGFSVGGRF